MTRISGIKSSLLVCVLPSLWLVHAATLERETLQDWNEYRQAAQLRAQSRVNGSAPFLWAAESDARLRKLRQGEIIAMPMSKDNPQKVWNGLIHDWIGAAFLPGATLDEVLSIVQDYPKYKEFYKPLVVDSRLDSKVEETAGPEFRFSLLMLNNSLFAKHAVESNWQESYIRLDANRAYSTAQTVSVKEIENYQSPSERMLPEGEGSGYIWRMYAMSRLEQRDGGVYAELEVIALSRDVPGGLRWLFDPIIRKVSRSSIVTSLTETRAAIHSATPKEQSSVIHSN